MTVPVKVESPALSAWLVWEQDGIGQYSREVVTVAASQTLVCGSVIGLNGGGQAVEFDGAVTAIGVVITPVTTGVGETAKCLVIRRQARITSAKLQWKTAITAPQKTAAIASLAAAGILEQKA